MDLDDFTLTITGGTTSRTFGTRFADILNVKDFGAVGDGIANDGPALQACFDAAYGTAGSPHGQDNGAWANKPVLIPAGIYKTAQQLILTHIEGAWVFGAGREATRIVYNGAMSGSGPGGATYVIMTRYARNCLFEDFTVAHETNDNSTAVAFGLLDGTGPLDNNAGNHNIFVNVGFENAVDGAILGWQATGLGSEFAFFDCHVEDCKWGYRVVDNQNALDHNIFGGRIENCEIGISNPSGSFEIITGVEFVGNTDWDIDSTPGSPTVVIGCSSTSDDNIRLSGGPMFVSGMRTTGTGRFANVPNSPLIVRASQIAGTLAASAASRLHAKSNTLSNANFLTDYTGTVVQNI